MTRSQERVFRVSAADHWYGARSAILLIKQTAPLAHRCRVLDTNGAAGGLHRQFEIWNTQGRSACPVHAACVLRSLTTPGQERYRSLAPMYYRGAAAALVVYDITSHVRPAFALVARPAVPRTLSRACFW
jgi:hypothetical protein